MRCRRPLAAASIVSAAVAAGCGPADPPPARTMTNRDVVAFMRDDKPAADGFSRLYLSLVGSGCRAYYAAHGRWPRSWDEVAGPATRPDTGPSDFPLDQLVRDGIRAAVTMRERPDGSLDLTFGNGPGDGINLVPPKPATAPGTTPSTGPVTSPADRPATLPA